MEVFRYRGIRLLLSHQIERVISLNAAGIQVGMIRLVNRGVNLVVNGKICLTKPKPLQ